MSPRSASLARALTACVLSLCCSRLAAGQTIMTFEGLSDNEPLGTYYSGGLGGWGHGPGPNLGVSISPATVRVAIGIGGSGEFAGEPSPSAALYLRSLTTINSTSGVENEITFFYANLLGTTEVRVFEGPNLTGRLLATSYFAPTIVVGGPGLLGLASRFSPAKVTFAGMAHSIGIVSRGLGGVYVDNLILGSGPVAAPTRRYTLRDLGPTTERYRLNAAPLVNGSGQMLLNTRPPDSTATRALFWDPALAAGIDLGTFGGLDTIGAAINDAGQVAGWASFPDRTAHAFIWSKETRLAELGSLGGQHSVAAGINSKGQVVGWASPASGSDPYHAFLWQRDEGMIDLNDLDITDRENWTLLERAYAISDNGVIVGSGVLSIGGSNVRHNFALVPSAVVSTP